MDASGGNGQISFDGTTIHITRNGFGGSTSHLQPWTMPVTAVTDVVFHEPGKIIPGFLGFTTTGHTAATNYVAAAKDQQSVVFKRKVAADFEAIRDAVRGAIGEQA